MTSFRRFFAVLAVALATSVPEAAMAGAVEIGKLTVSDAWSRATVSTSRPAVGYLTVTNKGTTGDRLIGAESPLAGRVKLHRSSMTDGVMRMQHVDGIDIPPGATVRLAPGGYHLMLMQPARVFREGDALPIILTFEKAGTVSVEAQVRAIGARSGHMQGH